MEEKKWYAKYYSPYTGSPRASLVIEPTTSYAGVGSLFDSKEAAESYFAEELVRHAKRVLARENKTNVLIKRLRKYGKSEVADMLQDLADMQKKFHDLIE